MCGGPRWKRDAVPDHKFDFIDTRDFTDYGCWMRMRYIFLYLLVLKSFMVYVFDIFTAITMLTTKDWSNHIFNTCPSTQQGCIIIPFSLGRWLFFGSIIVGFLLLAYEARKAKKIIASRDISYAFTNIMANNYYSLRSYDHFCFFSKINNSTKRQDDFAFFVFFTFKSWKRLILSDGPRQVINGLTLYSFYLSQANVKPFSIKNYTGGSWVTGALIISTATTVLIFAGSALLLLAAGVCYVPLLCYIRGNLKEYCCHKVDKRIEEIVKRKKKERLAQQAKLAKKEAMGDFSHLKNKKGEIANLPQPTLPNVTLDDDYDAPSVRSGLTGRSNTTRGYRPNNAYAGPDYPPAQGGYGQQYPYQQYGYGQGPKYAQSVLTVTTQDESLAHGNYDDEYNASSTNVPLAKAAAPMGMSAAPPLPSNAQFLAANTMAPDGPPSPGYPLSNPYSFNPNHQSVSDYGDIYDNYTSPVDGINGVNGSANPGYGHAPTRSQERSQPADGAVGYAYEPEPQSRLAPSEQDLGKRVSASSGLAYDDIEDAYTPDSNPNHYVHTQQGTGYSPEPAPAYEQQYDREYRRGAQPNALRDQDRWRNAQR